VPEIRDRQEALEELISDGRRSKVLSVALSKLSDLERLAVRVTSGTICPKDLIAVQSSLQELPMICEALQGTVNRYLSGLSQVPADLNEFADLIASSIASDAPRELTEGGIFVRGYNQDLDELRELLGGGKDWIESYQRKEQERTNIKSLKVNFNRTFGYYIEVTHSNKDNIPNDYIRKQTLTNAERFITPELKEYEAKILNAEKHISELEYKLFINLRSEITKYGAAIGAVAFELAQLDALISLAEVAIERNYVKPLVDDSLVLDIKQGRHPVLEKILPMGQYVANDCFLEGSATSQQMIILTGPNMAGKSSLLRQVAHIIVLAQMGSFVPADYARIGIVDRIFTRIGAVDDLTQGQSTFLVEMSETTQCCLSATARSLILLDEVGRGTSTYDGVAIAWSVAEYLAKDVQARTIFATHYHELNGLASFFPQIANFQVMVKEVDGKVEFIRTVMPGGTSKSFGIQVARMAGMPQKVIERAQSLMLQMEKKSAARQILDGPKFRNIQMDEVMQLSVFESANVAPVPASPEMAGKS
jgi:DNA mismatch repair protein MutS